MKKLEDIQKENIFNTPDGYFETLPGKIQSRILMRQPEAHTSFVYRYRLQYILSLLVLFAAGLYWYIETQSASDMEALLASIETEELIGYLNESDMTTEDILENITFYTADVEAIENEVYELPVNAQVLKTMLEEVDIENY